MDSQVLPNKLPPLILLITLVVLAAPFLWWYIFHVRSIMSITHGIWLRLWQENDGKRRSDTGTYSLYQDFDGQAARNKQARRGRCLLSLGKCNLTLFYTILWQLRLVCRWGRNTRDISDSDPIRNIESNNVWPWTWPNAAIMRLLWHDWWSWNGRVSWYPCGFEDMSWRDAFRLLAILIGRLGLTVEQAEKEFIGIMSYISSVPVNITILDRMLKTMVKKYTGDSETLMCDPNSPTSHCKM
jgi:hypothetical protein